MISHRKNTSKHEDSFLKEKIHLTCTHTNESNMCTDRVRQTLIIIENPNGKLLHIFYFTN